jgi:hypothetical protein
VALVGDKGGARTRAARCPTRREVPRLRCERPNGLTGRIGVAAVGGDGDALAVALASALLAWPRHHAEGHYRIQLREAAALSMLSCIARRSDRERQPREHTPTRVGWRAISAPQRRRPCSMTYLKIGFACCSLAPTTFAPGADADKEAAAGTDERDPACCIFDSVRQLGGSCAHTPMNSRRLAADRHGVSQRWRRLPHGALAIAPHSSTPASSFCVPRPQLLPRVLTRCRMSSR